MSPSILPRTVMMMMTRKKKERMKKLSNRVALIYRMMLRKWLIQIVVSTVKRKSRLQNKKRFLVRVPCKSHRSKRTWISRWKRKVQQKTKTTWLRAPMVIINWPTQAKTKQQLRWRVLMAPLSILVILIRTSGGTRPRYKRQRTVII